MKISKQTVIILLLLTIKFTLIAQTGIKVTYVKGLKTRTAPINKPPSILKDISFSLIATNEESIFHLDEKMMSDDLENRRHASKNIYYTNLRTKEKLTSERLMHKLYLVSNKFNRYKWKLLKESKNIGKYKCYKATCEELVFNPFTQKKVIEKTIAWYTLDIPLPFGPIGVDGLPGLILAIKQGSVYYIADKVEVNTNIKPNEIKKPTKGEKITHEKFNDYFNKLITKYSKKKK